MSFEPLYLAQSRVAAYENARAASFTLFKLAIVFLVIMLFYTSARADSGATFAVGISMMLFGLFYIGLGIWARWHAFAATLTGLLLYIFFAVYESMSNPSGFLISLIPKVVIVYILIGAVRCGYSARTAPVPGLTSRG